MKKLSRLSAMLFITLMCMAQIDTSKSYSLLLGDGLALDNGATMAQDASMTLAKYDDKAASQVWKIVHVKDDIYRLVSAYSLFALDNGNGATEHPVVQWTNDMGNENQLWRIRKQSGGMMRAFSSEPDARTLVSCFAFVTLMTRSLS